MTVSRTTTVAALTGAALAVPALFILILHGAGLTGQSARDHAMIVAAMYAGAVVVSGAIALQYWRRIDEVARDAQKSAWFLGGTVAIGVTAPLALWLNLTRGEGLVALLHGHGDAGVHFALGYLFAVLAQGAGFLLVWARWWLARR